MSLVRYKADIPAVILVLAVMLAQLSIFFLLDSHWLALALVLLLLSVQVSSGAVCHNHHHVNVFRRRGLNRLFEVIMYLQTGTSPFSWTLHHNIGHHRHYLDQDKDPAAWQEADGSLMNRIKFDVLNAARIYPEIMRIGRDHPTLYRRFKVMLVLANLPLLVFAVLDPLRTLIVFIGPMIFLLLALLDNTYGQHAGTGTENHYVASRNVELPLYNLTSWNLGYHTAHHLLPGLHWSELPKLHAKIRDKIPPDLIVNTMLLQWEPGRQQRRKKSGQSL
jgi:fatty acid desaturase